MSIRRYRIKAISPDAAGVRQHQDGEWVFFEDHKVEVARLRSKLDQAAKDSGQLARELLDARATIDELRIAIENDAVN